MSISQTARLYHIPINRFSSELKSFKSNLQDHRQTLVRLEACGDWTGVHGEQKKAANTLKKLKRSLQELEAVKNQLDSCQQDEFETIFAPIRKQANRSIEDFAEFERQLESAAAAALDGGSGQQQQEQERQQQQQQQQQQLVLAEQQLLHQRQEQLLAYETLQRDAADLREIFSDLSRITHEQAEQVDQVETHVETAQQNVAEGARQLALAARLSGGVAPAAGALLGGLVGGPVGLLAGAKIGSLAALGGGVLGYVGGRLVNAGRRGGDGPDPADPSGPPPRSPSAPARLITGRPEEDPTAATSHDDGAISRTTGAAISRLSASAGAAVCRLHIALTARLARLTAWLGKPVKRPEQPLDPVLTDDVEEAEEAAAVLLRRGSEPGLSRGDSAGPDR